MKKPLRSNMKKLSPLSTNHLILISCLIVLLAGIALYALGRVPWCACNAIKLWHGDPQSSETSQHIFDPYSFTHILHGLGYYLLLWFFWRGIPLGHRFLIALGIESSWEVLENTRFIIDRYRTATLSLNYVGDSIINSFGDIIASSVGFYVASRYPAWVSVLVVIVIELALLILIRDNLFLNILLLIHPIPGIVAWQMGG